MPLTDVSIRTTNLGCSTPRTPIETDVINLYIDITLAQGKEQVGVWLGLGADKTVSEVVIFGDQAGAGTLNCRHNLRINTGTHQSFTVVGIEIHLQVSNVIGAC